MKAGRTPALAVVALAMMFLLGDRQLLPASNSVTVTVSLPSSQITVNVQQQTNLRVVLHVLCQRTRAHCEVVEAASKLPVAPIVLVGSWADVMTSLLEGTGFNYAVISSPSGGSGRLLVEERSTGWPQVAGGSASATSNDATVTMVGLTDEEIRKLRAQQLETEAITPLPPPKERPGLTDEEIRQLRADQPPYSPPTISTLPSPDQMFAGADPERIKTIRGQSEKPVALSPEEIARRQALMEAFLGIPQAPQTPVSHVVSPFPGPNGEPLVMPVNNSAPPGMIMLPFPDPQGNPIYVPIKRKNQNTNQENLGPF